VIPAVDVLLIIVIFVQIYVVELFRMSEIQAVANFVSKKISKVRWRPTSKHVVQKPTIFASGSWDDNVRNVTSVIIWLRLVHGNPYASVYLSAHGNR